MKIILAGPRGFCAGVERAIKCVEQAIEQFGAPVYVLNDIVHNAAVVNELREKGAVFVKDLNDVPPGSQLLFSAHGVSPDRWRQAEERNLHVIDATCPLVGKVHNEARRFADKDFTIVLIGEKGHDEVIGTTGWAGRNVRIVFSEEEVEALQIPDETKMAYITQTTLSVDDCRRIVEALERRFPEITGPKKGDICYATQNRQAAVNAISPEADLVLVVGDRESANSNRLAEICHVQGKTAYLISGADMIEEEWLEGVETVLLTAGASAPESLVQGVVDYFRGRGPCEVEERKVMDENVHFKLPPALATPKE
ncbi:MAG: 4-hydroxy-3-methylbut-2-enyl diphosphate reductase [Candidatus Hydrogenedentes bacterium]|nr:4-hydroxy-3-methylbut-2-enyl diphosphate reductase [Candidatus Hydrogenedentota bacterium]